VKFIKLILTDAAGLGLIILAFLVGWIPGPGGIPLLLSGLGLLAINHAWARRLLRSLKANGLRLAERFFKDHPVLVIVYDVLAFLLLAGGVFIIININGVLKTGSTIFLMVGLALFLGNRKRSQRILRYFRQKQNNRHKLN